MVDSVLGTLRTHGVAPWLHPKETTFTWQESGWIGTDEGWLPGEATQLFEETRSFVESRGMRLTNASVTTPRGNNPDSSSSS
jgi:hypothetical protein